MFYILCEYCVPRTILSPYSYISHLKRIHGIIIESDTSFILVTEGVKEQKQELQDQIDSLIRHKEYLSKKYEMRLKKLEDTHLNELKSHKSSKCKADLTDLKKKYKELSTKYSLLSFNYKSILIEKQEIDKDNKELMTRFKVLQDKIQRQPYKTDYTNLNKHKADIADLEKVQRKTGNKSDGSSGLYIARESNGRYNSYPSHDNHDDDFNESIPMPEF